MTPTTYLRDRAPIIFLGIACCLGVGGMLAVLGVGADASLFVPFFVAVCWVIALVVDYARRHRFYAELVRTASDLDQTYYASELVEKPTFLEGVLTHEALEAVGKAAADDVNDSRQQAQAYRDYIELWIHEIKTPIAAAGLMASSLHGVEASRLKGELDRIEGYVEQALFFARSTSLTQDYAIREAPLADVVREACKKHARFLIEQGAVPVVDVAEDVWVFADVKWLAFVVGQLVVNAAKYGAHEVRFTAHEEHTQTGGTLTVLEVADDGWGIPAADVPRVFDRGFTGQNGRASGSSTGMGLYLVATLCEKMGLGVGLASEEGVGTRVTIAFSHDRRAFDLRT